MHECQVSEQLKKNNKNTKTTIINQYILGRHSSFKGGNEGNNLAATSKFLGLH